MDAVKKRREYLSWEAEVTSEKKKNRIFAINEKRNYEMQHYFITYNASRTSYQEIRINSC